MVSLLEKIGERKNENRPEDRPADSSAEITSSGNAQASSGNDPPTKCGCGSVLAWLDIYGGGPHCHGCRPWPAERFVKQLIGLEACDPASSAQAARWRVLWPLDGSGASATADRASCGHSHMRRRTTWPGTERGGRLVPDLSRVAEVEVFDECVDCGEWFRVSEFSKSETEV